MIDINDMNACNDINHNSDSDWRWAIMDSEAACSTQHRDDTLSDTAKAISALLVHSKSFDRATLEDIPDTDRAGHWVSNYSTQAVGPGGHYSHFNDSTKLNCQCH